MKNPVPTPRCLPFRCGGATDIGRRRARNEDRFLVLEAPAGEPAKGPRALFAVADGMGGHSAGDVAAKMACDSMRAFFARLGEPAAGLSPGAVRRSMTRSFFAIDQRIGRRACQEEKYAHMGTTLSAMILCAGCGIISHVGDSRIYRLRGKRLIQLTTDHTFVQDLISYGELTPGQAAVHPFRNMLTGALGTEEPLESVFAETVPLRPGDRFLLCTDGMYDMLDHEVTAEIMGRGWGAQKIAGTLVDAANGRGGKDNITAVVVLI